MKHREIKAWICKHLHSSVSTNSPAGCPYVRNSSVQTRCLCHTLDRSWCRERCCYSKLQTASNVPVPWARRSPVPWGILLGAPEANAGMFQIWLWGTPQGCRKQQGNRLQPFNRTAKEAQPVSWNNRKINNSFAPTWGKKWTAFEVAKCALTSGKQS